MHTAEARPRSPGGGPRLVVWPVSPPGRPASSGNSNRPARWASDAGPLGARASVGSRGRLQRAHARMLKLSSIRPRPMKQRRRDDAPKLERSTTMAELEKHDPAKLIDVLNERLAFERAGVNQIVRPDPRGDACGDRRGREPNGPGDAEAPGRREGARGVARGSDPRPGRRCARRDRSL